LSEEHRTISQYAKAQQTVSDFLAPFDDVAKKTVTIQEKVAGVDSNGIPTETFNDLKTVSLLWWTDESRVTSENDRFVDKARGRAILDVAEGITPDTTMRMTAGSEIYFVSGVDQVLELGEIYVITWTRDL